MLKAYKYRIFPTQEQTNLMNIIFGQVRFVYNLGLETKISAYAGQKKNIDCFDLIKQIKELKDNECYWLRDSPSQALQASVRNLDNAYTNFFKGKGFPKFKSKHGKQSFSLPQGVHLSENNKQILIPKLKYVDIDLHRDFKGEIKTVTVSRTTTNKYFVSILIENNKELPIKKLIKESTSVGVDFGIKDLCILSDGTKFENKEFLKSKLKELRVEKRTLSRRFVKNKKSDEQSNGYKKQKLIVALIHEKVKNQRQDYLHKISKYLVDNYNTICLEDLNVSNMSKTCKPKHDQNGKYISNGQMAKSGLNRAILDSGWANLRTMIEYKAEWYGKNVCIIGKFDPSSKTCSKCGNINKALTLDERTWTCVRCKTTHDRDQNAANNIKTFGLRNKPGVTQREVMT